MTRRSSPRAVLTTTGLGILAAAIVIVGLLTPTHRPLSIRLPLRHAGEMTLPGNGSRFDYASLDPGRGLLFIAHLGAGQVIEADIRAGRIVRTIPGLPDVHGVLVVPRLHRLYATATATNTVATLDEDTGRILA